MKGVFDLVTIALIGVRYVDFKGERGTLPIARPPVRLGFLNIQSRDMSTWPQYSAPKTPPANDNDGLQCARNYCMLQTEVSPEQLEVAEMTSPYKGFTIHKGCLYRCPGGKMKMNLLSTNISYPHTISDFPHEKFNNFTWGELLRLRKAGLRY